MHMPAFQAKKLVKGVSDETEVSDLQSTLAEVPGERFPYAHRTKSGGDEEVKVHRGTDPVFA